MTGRGLGLLLALFAGLSVAACSAPPNPVIAHDPVPPPARGYKVVCTSTPFIFHGFLGYCEPGQPPVVVRTRIRKTRVVKTRTVIRSKG